MPEGDTIHHAARRIRPILVGTVAGTGNLWKCEGCWEVQVDPWRAADAVGDDNRPTFWCPGCQR